MVASHILSCSFGVWAELVENDEQVDGIVDGPGFADWMVAMNIVFLAICLSLPVEFAQDLDSVVLVRLTISDFSIEDENW